MLKEIFEKLDEEVTAYNTSARDGGSARISKSTFKILGQTALIEAKMDLVLAETMDVDAYVTAHHWVKSKFNELLKTQGKFLDPSSNEVWMPKETEYDIIYDSQNLSCYIAQSDFVLLSKALKAPQKNKRIISEFVSKGASKRFLNLADKYKLNIKDIINE